MTDGCKPVPVGFFAASGGSVFPEECPGKRSGKHVPCFGNGVCDKNAGSCECNEGTGWSHDSHCMICPSEWNNLDGRCSSCKSNYEPWPPSAPNQCLVACTEGNERDENGLCAKPLWELVMKVLGIITGLLSVLILVYKIGIYIKVRKNGMLKSEYTGSCSKSTHGFFKVLAYGSDGNHIVRDLDKMKEDVESTPGDVEMQQTSASPHSEIGLSVNHPNENVNRRETSALPPMEVFFERIGLKELYLQRFVDEGYENMGAILEMKEEHFVNIGVKTGHMLQIQRALRTMCV